MGTELLVVSELFSIFVVCFVGVLLYLLPRLTRPDIYFATTVTRDFRDTTDGARILRHYRVETVVHSCIGLLLVLGSARIGTESALLIGLLWQMIGCFTAFYRARGRTRPHAVKPTSIREAEIKLREQDLPGGWILQLGPFALLIAAAIYLQLRWADLPAQFPVHWGFDGSPDRWTSRSLTGVYGGLVSAMVLCLIFALLGTYILRKTRRVRVSGSEGKGESIFRHRMASVLLAAEYFIALSIMWTAMLPLVGPPGTKGVVWMMGASMTFMVVIVGVMAATGQGGAAIAGSQKASLEDSRPVGDRTDDSFWKVGIFYVNPDDPAFLVEKRFGIGYTLNFGHPGSWILMAVIVLVPLIFALAR